MIQITTNPKSITFVSNNLQFEKAYNSVDYFIINNTEIKFQQVNTGSILASALITDVVLNGEQLTIDNADMKLKEALFY